MHETVNRGTLINHPPDAKVSGWSLILPLLTDIISNGSGKANDCNIWHHETETRSESPAHSKRNPMVTNRFPFIWPISWSFSVFWLLAWNIWESIRYDTLLMSQYGIPVPEVILFLLSLHECFTTEHNGCSTNRMTNMDLVHVIRSSVFENSYNSYQRSIFQISMC